MTLPLDRTSLAALTDARRNARASLAALKAMDIATVPADRRTELSRIAAALADVIAELAEIEMHARLKGES